MAKRSRGPVRGPNLHDVLHGRQVELFCAQAPKSCKNFLALAASGAPTGLGIGNGNVPSHIGRSFLGRTSRQHTLSVSRVQFSKTFLCSCCRECCEHNRR